jgi:hypothetical protein
MIVLHLEHRRLRRTVLNHVLNHDLVHAHVLPDLDPVLVPVPVPIPVLVLLLSPLQTVMRFSKVRLDELHLIHRSVWRRRQHHFDFRLLSSHSSPPHLMRPLAKWVRVCILHHHHHHPHPLLAAYVGHQTLA